MLAYGQTIDAYDEYRRIDESAYFKTFVKTVMEVFQHEFL